MAKGNDGNYLQHCVEVEAALRLTQAAPGKGLHIALTHGMKPFEELDKPKNAYRLLYHALCEAAREPKCNEREIVKAYRKSWERIKCCRPNIVNLFEELKTNECYPNSAELFRAVIGKDRLSGGITERCSPKHDALAEAWGGSKINVSKKSWREELGPEGVLCCPDKLYTPWLFSMDPMTYIEENNNEDDANLNRSDLDRLACALERYVDSGQPGIACFFVYGIGPQGKKNRQRQFWAFVDELAGSLGVRTLSYWVSHRGGNRNLVGLLLTDEELAVGFVPPNIEPGRGRNNTHPGTHEIAPNIADA